MLRSIDAPRGGGLLLSAVTRVNRGLVQLRDQIELPELERFRDAAQVALEILARFPQLYDEGYASADSTAFSKRFQVFARREYVIDRWHISALVEALLCHLLLIEASGESVDDLVALFHAPPPAVPDLPAVEPNAVARMRLLASFLTNHPRKNSRDTSAALALEKIANFVSDQSPKTARFEPNPVNLKHLQELKPDTESDGHQMFARDRIKKLANSIATRLAVSIRQDHTPQVRLVPSSHDIHFIGTLLANMHESRADWILCHALLGPYAKVLLGGGDGKKFRYSIKNGSTDPIIEIRAPSLGEKKERPPIAGCLDIREECSLPLPVTLLHKASKLCASPGYSYDKAARFARADLERWGSTRGFYLRLPKLHRALSSRIDGGAIDRTVQHLLGFAEAAPRDSGIYYFSPEICVLEARFKDAVSGLAEALGRHEILEQGWTTTGGQPGCMGISIRPDPLAVRRLVEHLSEASKLPPGKPSQASRQRAFNARASYLTILFLAASAARPTGSVFPGQNQILVEDGIVLLSEKDSLLYRSTRLSHLDERVCRGIVLFHDDRRSIETALRRTFDQELRVFLIDDAGNALIPSVSNMKRCVSGFAELWPWPDDVLRHHFRSRAWELGCPSDILARLLGHLPKSATPDGLFAARRIEDAIVGADPYIASLLDELGFQ